MKLPRWIKDLLGIVKEFGLALITCGLGVTALTLVMIGLATLLKWPIQELLRFYTPLMLGLFSIAITLYLFYRNVREGRERARQERDQGVRPILIAEAIRPEEREQGFFGHQTYLELECVVDSASIDRQFYIKLENVGLGVALNVEIFIRCDNEKYYLAAFEVPKIPVNDSQYVRVRCTLPDRIAQVITIYRDIFGNLHHCVHGFEDSPMGPKQMVIGNAYVSDYFTNKEELNKIEEARNRRPLTRAIFMTYGYTVDPKVAENDNPETAET